ncbi:unnamed protein product [Cylicocyclus nassatus]|uniref:Uncharacterized protein n=1 Tax=Cylicocyclus nassatus TaxID=53992 RepID=A0AA36H3I5_CYLNA|nr:unnamed protein product [Cylicocyclus nassatus]
MQNYVCFIVRATRKFGNVALFAFKNAKDYVLMEEHITADLTLSCANPRAKFKITPAQEMEERLIVDLLIPAYQCQLASNYNSRSNRKTKSAIPHRPVRMRTRSNPEEGAPFQKVFKQ